MASTRRSGYGGCPPRRAMAAAAQAEGPLVEAANNAEQERTQRRKSSWAALFSFFFPSIVSHQLLISNHGAAAQIRRTQGSRTRQAARGRGRGRGGRGRGRNAAAQPASVLGAPLDADERWLMSLSDDDEARMDAMFQDDGDASLSTDDNTSGGEGMRFLLFIFVLF